MQAELVAVDQAGRRLDEAERSWEAAGAEADAKQRAFADARRALDHVLGAWRTELHAWVARLDHHRQVNRLDGVTAPDLGTDLAARRDEVVTALVGAADITIELHVNEQANVVARRVTEQGTVDDLAAALDELDGRVLPSPPALSWQRHDEEVVLAELIDFRESVGQSERAGLEAAMEAAGLLGATVTAAGALDLAVGRLIVRPGRPAPEPLSRLLRATVADHDGVDVDPEAVEAILDAISTDAGALAGDDDKTVVTVDGRFRTGLLHGHHSKPQAEHIGLTARRAALQRQRTEARVQLEAARIVLAGTDRDLAAGRKRIAGAQAIRAALPPATAVTRSVLAAETADNEAVRTGQVHADRRRDRDRADTLHAEAIDKSRRTAANLDLSTDPESLRRVDEDLRQSTRLTDQADVQLTGLVRAVTQWRSNADNWRRAVEDERQATQNLTEADHDHEAVAARLATLEDSIGVAYTEIVVAIQSGEAALNRTSEDLETARRAQLDGTRNLATAEDNAKEWGRRHDDAASQAMAALPGLRRALEVPGLLAAALAVTTAVPFSPPDVTTTTARAAVMAPVDETPEGTKILAAAIETYVPAFDRPT